MTTKLIILVLFCILALKSKCQYVIAGVPGPIYTDIAPDTTIQASGILPNYYAYGFFDINQNGSFDHRFQSENLSAQGTYDKTVNLSRAISQNIEFDLGSIDSSWSTPSGILSTRRILKKYLLGDTINPVTFTGVPDGYITYSHTYIGPPPYYDYYYSDQWLNPGGEGFVGVKYYDSTGVRYGWIRIEPVSYTSCIVKESSLSSLFPVNIKSLSTDEKYVAYPNPCDNKLQLQLPTTEVASLCLTDMCGRILKTFPDFSNNDEIDVSSIPSGIYFLQIQSKRGITVEKIIIHH